MKIEQLLYFISVSQTLSFNKTAELFFITPQGLSKALKNLEFEFNVQLLESTKQGTSLTEDGKHFLNKALEIVEIYDNLKTHYLKNVDSEIDGEISIACQPRISANFLLPILSKFQAKYPNISTKISSKEVTAKDIFDSMQNSKIDLGLCILSKEDFDFISNSNIYFFTEFLKEEIFVCVLKHYSYPLPEFFTQIPENLIDYLYVSPFTNEILPSNTSDSSIIISPEMQMHLIALNNGLGNILNREYEKYYAKTGKFTLIPYRPPLFLHFICVHKNPSLLTMPEQLFLDTLKSNF